MLQDLEGKIRKTFGGRKKFLWGAGAVFLAGVITGSCNTSVKFPGTYNGDPMSFSKVESFSKGDKVRIDSAEIGGETTKGIVDIVQIKTTKQGKQYAAEVGSRNDTKKLITISSDGTYQINLLPAEGMPVPNFNGKELPIGDGEKLVYVFDRTSCCCDSYFDAQKGILKRSISSLEEDVKFGLVVYDCEAAVWRRELVPATDANKRNARGFVDSLNLGPAHYNNPTAALTLAAETFGKSDVVVLLAHPEQPANELAYNPDLAAKLVGGAKVYTFITTPYYYEDAYDLPGGNPTWDFVKSLASKTGGKSFKIGLREQ